MSPDEIVGLPGGVGGLPSGPETLPDGAADPPPGGRKRAEAAAERLRDPAFARLWRRSRDAFERTGGRLATSIRLSDLSPEESRALPGFLGRPAAGGLSVSLADLDRRLRDTVGCELAGWLSSLSGPLRDRPAERAGRLLALGALRDLARSHPVGRQPWVEEWLGGLEADGLLTRLASGEPGPGESTGGAADLRVALDTLAALPAEGISVAVLSARLTGDTKRLTDPPVSTLVERGLAVRSGMGSPAIASQRHALWARFGVRLDWLTNTVAALNLPLDGQGPLPAMTAAAAVLGEPCVMTLRQLTAWPVTAGAGEVFVCENPAVVMEAATALGPRSRPLICTAGIPNEAFWGLAAGVAAGGGTLAVHADFDRAGVGIVRGVIDRVGARAWRFGAEDYRRAVARFGGLTLPPVGTVGPTPWDADLGPVLADSGVAVFEELVLADLLDDLA